MWGIELSLKRSLQSAYRRAYRALSGLTGVSQVARIQPIWPRLFGGVARFGLAR